MIVSMLKKEAKLELIDQDEANFELRGVTILSSPMLYSLDTNICSESLL